ncbi:MAG: DUF2085 domain-containing protein [Thermoplasmata archaeon]|nr:DUF2085 domain-containing protein [Thermoplasmata archaeon]
MERGNEPRPWEIILSHHLPHRYGRTIGVRIRGRTVRFCSRCSGQLLGAATFLLVALLRADLPFSLTALSVQLLFAGAPLPAALDWLLQSTGRRESSNPVRLLSGLLLGFSLTDVLFLLVTRAWLFVAGALLIFVVYVVAVLLVLRLTGGLRQVLDEHFPGWESEATP